MANREKGEFEFDVNGQPYIFRADLNALALAESVLSTPDRPVFFQDILQRAERGQLLAMRALFWACLKAYHPAMTLEEAGQLIQDLGGIAGANAALQQAIEAAVPAPSGAASGNPPKARRGPGNGSTSGRAA